MIREEVVVLPLPPSKGVPSSTSGGRRWRFLSSQKRRTFPVVVTVAFLALHCGIEIGSLHDVRINTFIVSTETTTLDDEANNVSPPPSISSSSSSIDAAITPPPPPHCPDYSRSSNITSIILSPTDHQETIRTRLSHLFNGTTTTEDELFGSCLPTCHVRLIPKCPYWELETVDCYNRTKTIGGDEFYLTYSDVSSIVEEETSKDVWTQPVTAVAFWTDQKNGRYLIDFQASPMSQQHPTIQSQPSSYSKNSSSGQGQPGGGFFTIYFQYTCGIGRIADRLKASWPHGGQTVGWVRSSVLPNSIAPPIRPFQRLNNEWEERHINLFEFSNILPIGDSILRFFLMPLGIEFPNINSPLSQGKLELWKSRIEAKVNDKNHSESVLIMGSCAWDIIENQNVSTTTWNIDTAYSENTTDDQATNSISHVQREEWQDHREALTNLLTHVRTTYPELTVVWKSCAGLHIHVPYLYPLRRARRKYMEERLKYMSTYRATSIRHVQAEVLQQAQLDHPGKVYYIDVYPAYYLSSHMTKPGDGLHYRDTLDFRVSHWYVNESVVEQSWRRRQLSQPTSTWMMTDYHEKKGWVEWVNTALLAKVTRRQLIWGHEDTSSSLRNNTSNIAFQLEGVVNITQEQLLTSEDLVNNSDIRVDRDAKKFISKLFTPEISGSNHLYGMILHRILEELAIDQTSPMVSWSVSPPNGGHTVMIAPFSAIPDPSVVEHAVEESLSDVFANETNMTEDCIILVPTEEWSIAISSKTIEHYNCAVQILPSSLDHPSETLFFATELVESYGSSSLILSCSVPASNLYLHLLDYLLQARAHRLGILPWLDRFPHRCLS